MSVNPGAATNASATFRIPSFSEGMEAAYSLVSKVKGSLVDESTGEKVLDYLQFSPFETETLTKDVAKTDGGVYQAELIIELNADSLLTLDLVPNDLEFVLKVRDKKAAVTKAARCGFDVMDDYQAHLEVRLSDYLKHNRLTSTEFSVDVLSKKPPVGIDGWSEFRRLTSFTIAHSSSEVDNDFPPHWLSPEGFKKDLGLPAETLAFFDSNFDPEGPRTKARLYLNTDYRKEITEGASESSAFFSLCVAEMVEAALRNSAFSIEENYAAGSIGASINSLLERKLGNLTGLGSADIRRALEIPEDGDSDHLHSLARLSMCMGSKNMKALLA